MYLCGDSGDYVGDNGSVGIGSVSCASSNGWCGCGDNNNSMLLIILVIMVIIIATILMLLIVMIEVMTITTCVS